MDYNTKLELKRQIDQKRNIGRESMDRAGAMDPVQSEATAELAGYLRAHAQSKILAREHLRLRRRRALFVLAFIAAVSTVLAGVAAIPASTGLVGGIIVGIAIILILGLVRVFAAMDTA